MLQVPLVLSDLLVLPDLLMLRPLLLARARVERRQLLPVLPRDSQSMSTEAMAGGRYALLTFCVKCASWAESISTVPRRPPRLAAASRRFC